MRRRWGGRCFLSILKGIIFIAAVALGQLFVKRVVSISGSDNIGVHGFEVGCCVYVFSFFGGGGMIGYVVKVHRTTNEAEARG
jgi:hypothetical protein